MIPLALASAFLASAPLPAFGNSGSRTLAQADPSVTPGSSFTFPTPDFPAEPSGCSNVMTGCTGSLSTLQHSVAGDITVIDDCTFQVTGWEFDGQGPAVEWWAAPSSGDPTVFPYDEGMAIMVAVLRTNDAAAEYVPGPLGGGPSDITVRLGTNTAGQQILLSPELDHISVWCRDIPVDFGNAVLSCPAAGPGMVPMAAPAPADAPVDAPTSTDAGTPMGSTAETPMGADADTSAPLVPAAGATPAPGTGATPAPGAEPTGPAAGGADASSGTGSSPTAPPAGDTESVAASRLIGPVGVLACAAGALLAGL